jgi:hypothetical protein
MRRHQFHFRPGPRKHPEQLIGDTVLHHAGAMPGGTDVITCGEPMGYAGGTNMLKVFRVD